MFKIADELAKRADEKKLIIAGIKTVVKPDALDMLKKYLDNADVKSEAEQATTELEKTLNQQGRGGEKEAPRKRSKKK